MKRLVFLSVYLLASVAQTASTEVISSRTDGYTDVLAGTVELSFDNMLLVNFDSEDNEYEDATVSTIMAHWTIGPIVRWFIADNFSLSFNPNFFLNVRKQTTTIGDNEYEDSKTEYGVLGFIMAHYYIKAGTFFFTPGVGAGGYWGKCETPAEDNPELVMKETIYGGAARLDLNLLFYTSDIFNIHAGLTMVVWFGSGEKDEAGPVQAEDIKDSMFALDAGFNVGFTFVL